MFVVLGVPLPKDGEGRIPSRLLSITPSPYMLYIVCQKKQGRIGARRGRGERHPSFIYFLLLRSLRWRRRRGKHGSPSDEVGF